MITMKYPNNIPDLLYLRILSRNVYPFGVYLQSLFDVSDDNDDDDRKEEENDDDDNHYNHILILSFENYLFWAIWLCYTRSNVSKKSVVEILSKIGSKDLILRVSPINWSHLVCILYIHHVNIEFESGDLRKMTW